MCVCVCVCVRVCTQLAVTPWTVAHHSSLSMGFSRQEEWAAISYSRGSSRSTD